MWILYALILSMYLNVILTISIEYMCKAQVSDKSMNHIIMTKKNWKVYTCRYAERYQCVYDYVICEHCYNNNNQGRSWQSNSINAQKLNDMINPFFNEHTGEAWCVDNPVEYHKVQYLNMSDSAHIWIPSWRRKKRSQCRRKQVGSMKV